MRTEMTTDLTRDRIMELKAGPSLDALVAEHVMGFERMKDDQGYVDLIEPRIKEAMQKRYGFTASTEPLTGADVPKYSTSIQDAFKVVEKMHEGGVENGGLLSMDYKSGVELDDFEKFFYVVRFRMVPHNYIEVRSVSAPEALCKAALLAKLR